MRGFIETLAIALSVYFGLSIIDHFSELAAHTVAAGGLGVCIGFMLKDGDK